MNSHEILMVKQYPSGAEEWYCPTCGRRFMIQWSPEYRYVILDEGQNLAIHNMGRGALMVNRPEEAQEQRLAPWTDWLNHIDLIGRLGEEV